MSVTTMAMADAEPMVTVLTTTPWDDLPTMVAHVSFTTLPTTTRGVVFGTAPAVLNITAVVETATTATTTSHFFLVSAHGQSRGCEDGAAPYQARRRRFLDLLPRTAVAGSRAAPLPHPPLPPSQVILNNAVVDGCLQGQRSQPPACRVGAHTLDPLRPVSGLPGLR